MSAADLAKHFLLDRGVVFLNHGSFGACPIPVLEEQNSFRERMEREPVVFLVDELEPLLDAARKRLAAFVGAGSEDLVFVPNATTGFNAVLRSLSFGPGDEILATNHGYNAARNAIVFVAERSGARFVTADVPFPLSSAGEVLDAILRKVTSRTRLALIDHVTSPSGVIFPIRDIVAELQKRGIDTLVDGAHAPGMLPLHVNEIGAAYYTGNCHKWISAPKGAAFLHVRKDRQDRIRPTSISHGLNSPRTDRSRFLLEFDWTGTTDPTAWLCIPVAIEFIGSILPGGWPAVMKHNRDLVLEARAALCDFLRIRPPVPEEMIGSMATVPLPDGPGDVVLSPLDSDPLHHQLMKQFRIELPVWPWPQSPRRVLRVSAYLYNEIAHYQTLISALRRVLGS